MKTITIRLNDLGADIVKEIQREGFTTGSKAVVHALYQYQLLMDRCREYEKMIADYQFEIKEMAATIKHLR